MKDNRATPENASVTTLVRRTERFKALMERIASAPDPDVLTMSIDEAEVYIPMTKGQLSQLRYTGTGPKFLKPAPRTILYRKRDLDEWLNASEQITTAKSDEELERRTKRIKAYGKSHRKAVEA